MPRTFQEWFSRNYHIGDFQSLPLDAQERIKTRFEHNTNGEYNRIPKKKILSDFRRKQNEHDKLLLKIISEKEPIKSGALYLEYIKRRAERPVYKNRNYRIRLKKLRDDGHITAKGYGRAREYDKKAKTGDK